MNNGPMLRPFFQVVDVLRQRHQRSLDYNVFTALRSESDEVRLHSRFIASLIDQRTNPKGELFLKTLLRELRILGAEDGVGFSFEGVKVRTEFWRVDILITNARKQAVIIENKIYAPDQERQLARYYRRVKKYGYLDVYVRYLTLHGGRPEDGSFEKLKGDLDKRHLDTASYRGEIRRWLERSLGYVAREAAIRESVIQYLQLIAKLTGTDQGEEYMDALVDTLMQDGNMKLARDIRAAYIEGLIRLQEKFWLELLRTIKDNYPDMHRHVHEDSVSEHDIRDHCDAYYKRQRDNKYYGVYYSVPAFKKITVGAEIEQGVYLGVCCDDGSASAEYRRCGELLKREDELRATSDWWPTFQFLEPGLNFREPAEQDLDVLTSPDRRTELVQTASEEMFRLWDLMCRATNQA